MSNSGNRDPLQEFKNVCLKYQGQIRNYQQATDQKFTPDQKAVALSQFIKHTLNTFIKEQNKILNRPEALAIAAECFDPSLFIELIKTLPTEVLNNAIKSDEVANLRTVMAVINKSGKEGIQAFIDKKADYGNLQGRIMDLLNFYGEDEATFATIILACPSDFLASLLIQDDYQAFGQGRGYILVLFKILASQSFENNKLILDQLSFIQRLRIFEKTFGSVLKYTEIFFHIGQNALLISEEKQSDLASRYREAQYVFLGIKENPKEFMDTLYEIFPQNAEEITDHNDWIEILNKAIMDANKLLSKVPKPKNPNQEDLNYLQAILGLVHFSKYLNELPEQKTEKEGKASDKPQTKANQEGKLNDTKEKKVSTSGLVTLPQPAGDYAKAINLWLKIATPEGIGPELNFTIAQDLFGLHGMPNEYLRQLGTDRADIERRVLQHCKLAAVGNEEARKFLHYVTGSFLGEFLNSSPGRNGFFSRPDYRRYIQALARIPQNRINDLLKGLVNDIKEIAPLCESNAELKRMCNVLISLGAHPKDEKTIDDAIRYWGSQLKIMIDQAKKIPQLKTALEKVQKKFENSIDIFNAKRKDLSKAMGPVVNVDPLIANLEIHLAHLQGVEKKMLGLAAARKTRDETVFTPQKMDLPISILNRELKDKAHQANAEYVKRAREFVLEYGQLALESISIGVSEQQKILESGERIAKSESEIRDRFNKNRGEFLEFVTREVIRLSDKKESTPQERELLITLQNLKSVDLENIDFSTFLRTIDKVLNGIKRSPDSKEKDYIALATLLQTMKQDIGQFQALASKESQAIEKILEMTSLTSSLNDITKALREFNRNRTEGNSVQLRTCIDQAIHVMTQNFNRQHPGSSDSKFLPLDVEEQEDSKDKIGTKNAVIRERKHVEVKEGENVNKNVTIDLNAALRSPIPFIVELAKMRRQLDIIHDQLFIPLFANHITRLGTITTHLRNSSLADLKLPIKEQQKDSLVSACESEIKNLVAAELKYRNELTEPCVLELRRCIDDAAKKIELHITTAIPLGSNIRAADVIDNFSFLNELAHMKTTLSKLWPNLPPEEPAQRMSLHS